MAIDHGTTSFAIAMAANVPTVAFLNPSIWAPSRQAEPIFERFRKMGVVVDDGKSAAKQVEKIWDNVDGWWNQPEIQTARLSFCQNYARTDQFWLMKWIKALWKL